MSTLIRVQRDDTRKRLTACAESNYSDFVAKKEATGFGDSNKVRRTTAAWRLFFVRMPLHAPLNERALVGIPSGMPDASFSGSPTLPCARSPRLATECGFSTLKEAYHA